MMFQVGIPNEPVLCINRQLCVDYNEAKPLPKVFILRHDARGELQITLIRIGKARDVLSRFVELDLASAHDPCGAGFGGGADIKYEVRPAGVSIQFHGPIALHSAGDVTRQTGKYVAIGDDNLPSIKAWFDHRFVPVPEVGCVQRGIGSSVEFPSRLFGFDERLKQRRRIPFRDDHVPLQTAKPGLKQFPLSGFT